jgi:exodeoxyribonuclease-3
MALLKRTFYVMLSMLSITFSAYAQHKIKNILSYNVLKGFQSDTANVSRYVSWVNKKSPDIVFYQEMNGFTQTALEVFARRYGHNYAVLGKETGYAVALTSRYPIANAQKMLKDMWHGYIYANIEGINVFVVHLSPFLYLKRREEVKQILAHAATLPAHAPVIIAGDFNSYQARDSMQYTAKELQSQLTREQKNSEIRNLHNGKFDYSVTGDMENAGYKDAVNVLSNQFNYSMPTQKYDAPYKSKIRIDYIWLNQSLVKNIKKANVVYDDNTHIMSDHYPVWLQLK